MGTCQVLSSLYVIKWCLISEPMASLPHDFWIKAGRNLKGKYIGSGGDTELFQHPTWNCTFKASEAQRQAVR